MSDLDILTSPDTCEVCGGAVDENDSYSVAAGGDPPEAAETFTLCPSCASILVDEIAANIPKRYLGNLADAVARRAARREPVAR